MLVPQHIDADFVRDLCMGLPWLAVTIYTGAWDATLTRFMPGATTCGKHANQPTTSISYGYSHLVLVQWTRRSLCRSSMLCGGFQLWLCQYTLPEWSPRNIDQHDVNETTCSV
jgi:hypothetical protein